MGSIVNTLNKGRNFMGHHSDVKKDLILQLVERLHQYPVGAPKAPEIFEILKILYTEEEALIGSKFPMTEATLEEISKSVAMESARVKELLESMMDKALIIDFEVDGKTYYMLTPTVVGFFEFNFMRVNKKLPQKRLAELMHKYIHAQLGDDFFGSKTQFMRSVAADKSLSKVTSQIATHEQVKDIVRNAGYGSLAMCYCRHTAHHLGTPCEAPLENICIGLGYAAQFLVRRGFAREASTVELLDAIDLAESKGLVHIVDNVRDNPTFICNCCGCCCEVLTGLRERKIARGVRPSDFISHIQEDKCAICGSCAKACPIASIDFINGKKEDRSVAIDLERCIGCGVCVSACKKEAMELIPRQKPEYLPKNNGIKLFKIAYEKGRLWPMLKDGLVSVFKGHPAFWKNPFLG
jgi:Pyruvate/2-oxoacid:ferredoxin oxidoreductase delta subunit